MFDNIKARLNLMKSQESSRPEKGDMIVVEGSDTLFLVTDVVTDDTVCRVSSLRKNDLTTKVIPFWQIKTNYSTSCK